MGSGMTEVLSFQINRVAHMLGKAAGLKKRGGPPCEKVQEVLEFPLKLLIGTGFPISFLQLF
jgi:hypothetical protein